MPAYPNIIPDWLKSENASVFDPAWKRGLRKVGSLLGVDDPAGQVMGTVGPMMAAGEGLGPLASKAVGGLKGFYSRLSNAMGSIPEMVNPSKAMSIAKNQASGEEIGYRKLGEFLSKQPPNQRMPKSAILQHLEQNPPPQLEVKRYGQVPGTLPNDVVPGTTYSQYQIPGGQNYREDLIKLPVSEEQAKVATYWPEDRPHYLPPDVPAPYTSMHWPEDPNTLVHVRSAEHRLPVSEEDLRRIVPPSEGPKGRLIENIQSDWHQAGAREGYAGRIGAVDELPGEPGVPDAPFKQNWADLALKQQLLDLAEDPQLEWIGITPGSESVKRGELLKPEFHDVTLPRKLGELLKPFGGKVETEVLPGSQARVRYSEAVLPHRDPNAALTGQARPVIGYEGRVMRETPEQTEHVASVWPMGKREPGIVPELRGMANDLSQVIAKQPISAARGIPFQLAHLTPEMKAAILKKGFPLMSLLGLMNAAPQREK